MVRPGEIAAVVLDVAIEERARLIIVADSSKPDATARLLGEPWTHISHHAPCSRACRALIDDGAPVMPPVCSPLRRDPLPWLATPDAGQPRGRMQSPVVTISDGAATLQLSGELAMEATFTVEPALERALTLPSVDRVVLDLSALSFIDSVGMSLVVRFAYDLQARVIPLRIIPAPPAVHRVFELTGVAEALPFERDAV